MKISLDVPTTTFKNHLSLPSNKRILFSGKFGTGKSYFLDDYFELHKDTINTFWLSPVKYSVGLNEDIFEFIKFDIALRLIAMPEFAPALKEKFDEEQYIYQFLSSQPSVVFDALITSMQTLSTQISPESDEAKVVAIAASVKSLATDLLSKFQKYNEFKKKIDAAANESISSTFKKYLEESVLKRGSIFEDDLITQTIRTALAICKENSAKENVLIIDDFDRLDPEHVFRILNILSVHNDMFNNENKFGFDKIIVVCDYDNIEKIYAHKYGKDISFAGYIGKFYSTEVFHFDNSMAIQHFCQTELSDLISNKDAQDVLALLLSYFVENRLITMRDIVKIDIPRKLQDFSFGPYDLWHVPKKYPKSDYKQFTNTSNYIYKDQKYFYIDDKDFPFLEAIRILILIFGGYPNLVKILKNLSENIKDSYDKEYNLKIVKSFASILTWAKNYQEPGRIAFSFDSYDDRVIRTFPTLTILGATLKMPIVWHVGNLYTGQSFYKDIVKELASLEDVHTYKQSVNNMTTTYKSFLTEILVVLDVLGKTPYMVHAGLTKG